MKTAVVPGDLVVLRPPVTPSLVGIPPSPVFLTYDKNVWNSDDSGELSAGEVALVLEVGAIGAVYDDESDYPVSRVLSPGGTTGWIATKWLMRADEVTR